MHSVAEVFGAFLSLMSDLNSTIKRVITPRAPTTPPTTPPTIAPVLILFQGLGVDASVVPGVDIDIDVDVVKEFGAITEVGFNMGDNIEVGVDAFVCIVVGVPIIVVRNCEKKSLLQGEAPGKPRSQTAIGARKKLA